MALIQIGVGPIRGRKAARWIVRRYEPTLLLVTGFAGGLDSTLKVGATVVATQVIVDAESSEAPIDTVLLDVGSDRTDPILQSSIPIATGEQKRTLFDRTGCVAVEMESFAIAQVAREFSVPIAVIRAISDDARTALPVGVTNMIRANGTVDARAAIVQIANSPGLILDLIRVQRDVAKARKALAEVINVLKKR